MSPERPKVLVKEKIADPGVELLKEQFDVEIGTDWPDGELERRIGEFDAIVMAGNVMIFVAPGTEAAVVANLASHLGPGGILVAGFQTGSGRLSPEEYESCCSRAGLRTVARWSTWDRRPHDGDGTYVVSVHARD